MSTVTYRVLNAPVDISELYTAADEFRNAWPHLSRQKQII
jgi:hypothetical protein